MNKLKNLLALGGILCVAGFLVKTMLLRSNGKLLRSHSRKAVYYV